MTKELDGQPVQQADGSWLLSYFMTVTNPAPDVDLSYGLVDEVDYPEGSVITVESASGRPGSPDVVADWDGQTQTQLVADGAALPANAQHVFDVTLRVVLPDDQRSEPGGWANSATVQSGVGGVITTEALAEADILIPELEISKTATPSAPFLRIGDTVEYEITIENTGEGDFTALYPAVFWDDLSDVLDDAELSADPVAAPETGTFAFTGGPEYRFQAPLLAEESITIRYTVAVADRGGNADLVNVAYVSTVLDDEIDAPAPEDCVDPACATTETPLAALDISKTVDQSSVAPGSTVSYTVTITNSGNADILDIDPAIVTDDLSDVLDDATYRDDAAADTGTVELTGSTLTWTGGLAAGETATITYSVLVDPTAPDGAEIVNLVVSDPTLLTLALDGGEAVRQVSTTSVVQRMANTGVDTWAGLRIAALLVALGAALAFIRQRRRLHSLA